MLYILFLAFQINIDYYTIKSNIYSKSKIYLCFDWRKIFIEKLFYSLLVFFHFFVSEIDLRLK